jgi:hypothetical protein
VQEGSQQDVALAEMFLVVAVAGKQNFRQSDEQRRHLKSSSLFLAKQPISVTRKCIF